MSRGRYRRLRCLQRARADMAWAQMVEDVSEIIAGYGFRDRDRFVPEYCGAYGAMPFIPARTAANR
jgi:hypothetical protein